MTNKQTPKKDLKVKCPNSYPEETMFCCDKQFKNKKALSNHIRWHKGKMNKSSYLNLNLGSSNPMWKGDAVGKDAVHEWVKRRLPKPELCQSCNLVFPCDLANISQQYKRDLVDWEYLCRKCHMIKDGRLQKFATLERDFKKGRWSLLHDFCKKCSRSTKKHEAKGLCRSCYTIENYKVKKHGHSIYY